MGIKLYEEPEIEKPIMLATWPGIGRIGIIAIDYLRKETKAKEFGRIEPWDFFYPKKVSIRAGQLEDLKFPSSKFYFAKTDEKDLVFFIGEEQPTGGGYANGGKVYQLANLVLDVAQKFDCQRVYTSGAAVAPVHHTARPGVWAVPNAKRLIDELKEYDNIIIMSEIEGRAGQGNISGLNGLLLGVAKRRGLDAVCLLGEIPFYLQSPVPLSHPIVYPKASKSVLEVLSQILGIRIDLSGLDDSAQRVEEKIEELYKQIPSQIKSGLEKLKHVSRAKDLGPITKQEMKDFKEHFDEYFKEFYESGGRSFE
jgi:hypothetical protein